MQKYKILLIEDDKTVLDNLTTLFKLNNYEVYTATDGAEGIPIAIEVKPDIILSDVVMKDVNGYDVLKYIRSSVELFATPFIFLSGCNENDDLRVGMELGADDYITKPFDNKVLLNAVNSRLNKHLSFKNHYESRIEDIKKTLITSVPLGYRTPMNTILGFSHFLRENCKEVSPDEAYKMLDMINRAGRRLLTQLININLYYSFHTEFDFEQYKDELTTDPIKLLEEQAVDLGYLYDKSFKLLKLTNEQKLRVYNEHFIKIVTEIIDNAYKFSSKKIIEIIVESFKDTFIITIKNYGKSLSPNEISKIGAFTQFDRDTQEQQGSGLGFTISKVLSKLYGGTLEIKSENGVNSVEIKLTRVI